MKLKWWNRKRIAVSELVDRTAQRVTQLETQLEKALQEVDYLCTARSVYARSISTQSLSIVDQKGRTRGTFEVDKSGRPMLCLWDDDGKIRLDCYVTEDGMPGLHLCDGEGKTRVAITLSPNGIPFVSVNDREGNMVAGLDGFIVAENGEPDERFDWRALGL